MMQFQSASKRLPRVRTRTIVLSGGIDVDTPQVAVREGYVLEADNFEPALTGGYRKMLGYERLDGQPKPSDAVYYTLAVDDSSGVSIDMDITGSVSGATARVVIKDDDLNLLGLTNLTGEFEAGDVVAGATVQSPQISDNYPDGQISEEWRLAAQDYYRGFINPVPGTGSVLGVWRWNGKEYGFRSDGSVVKMYESSPTGWQEVTLYRLLQWDGGTLNEGDVVEGDTITGATSGATGTIKRFVKVSGSYGTDAVGYLVVDVTSGTFQDDENIEHDAVTVFVANGADEAIEFSLGDNRFEFVNYNFSGSPNTYYMYGCDAVNRAFEWDGSVLTPIITGTVNDAPKAIEAHQNHLFLGFDGGSLQNSAPTTPLVFNAILGSAEFAVGTEIQQLRSVAGESLLISTDRGIQGLYGDSVDNWSIDPIAVDAGDVSRTLDVIGTPHMVTNRGITRIDASDKYGFFESSTVTRLIKPILALQLSVKSVIGASIVRDKNQYRVYFDDGSGIILTSDQLYGQSQLPPFTTFTMDHKPTCLCSVAEADSQEVVLFGAEDGYIYQQERGYSHDGGEMQYAVRTPFMHFGSPEMRKGYKWIDFEIDADGPANIRLSYELSDGYSHTSQSPLNYYTAGVEGGTRAYWDEGVWSEFFWNDKVINRQMLSIEGSGHNISVLAYQSSATAAPFTLNSMTFQYIPRRMFRG